MQTVDFEKALNAEQLTAVTAPDGPILVLAAAGTGKTRTLVYRVAYLVGRDIPPERILLLTFTNRAAREMLERARELVGEAVGGVWGGTFHHLANRMLRRHARRLGYTPEYVILDRDDSRSLITRCLKDMKLYGKEFPNASVLIDVFSAATNTRHTIEDLVAQRFADLEVDAADVIRARDAYESKKRALGAMDFDDMLVNCLRLFRECPEVSDGYQQQFAHVLVDEYQDTNMIQAEIVDRIAERNRNVLVVGDDFQSIYSWRGADYRNIMSFPERYSDARVYKLEQNYRSVPEILRVANACIAGNPEQYQKTLRPTREAHMCPRMVSVRDGDEQARFVVDRIRHLRREGYRPQDIAVLYRAHFHALEVERELSHARMPYVITSGVRFFEQAHVKDVCSLLRLVHFPSDELAFVRVISLLPGVGPKTSEGLWEKLGRNFNTRDKGQRKALQQALRPQAQGAWQAVDTALTDHSTDADPAAAVRLLHAFVEGFYEPYLIRHYDDAEKRMEDIDALLVDLGRFESVESFLSDVALLTNLDAEADVDGDTTKESVRLSTVHQAKGLEWPVVIVVWTTEGMFPSSRAVNESEGGEAEERRLFYVAVTRAKDELYFCVPEVRRMRDGGVMYCLPSRFVQEIPREYLQCERAGFV